MITHDIRNQYNKLCTEAILSLNNVVLNHLDTHDSFNKIHARIPIKITLNEVYTRSASFNISFNDITLTEIIYLPTSKSLISVLETANDKITKLVNKNLYENDLKLFKKLNKEATDNFISRINEIFKKGDI